MLRAKVPRSLRKRFRRRTRIADKHVRLAVLLNDTVEKCTELCRHKRCGNIGNLLHELFQIKLRGQPRTDAIEQFSRPASFLFELEEGGTFLFCEFPIRNVPRYF